MTTLASPSWVSHLSRRKLQKVADDSSDTLRRCVLIHNIMRSTAASDLDSPIPAPPTPPPQQQQDSQPQFVFPSMGYAQEQQWLDSLLDDLVSEGGDISVSVVPVIEDSRNQDECPSCSSPPRPASPPIYYDSLDSLFYQDEVPSSPPPLEAHNDSDDDDDEDSDSEVSTPSASTESLGDANTSPPPPNYFLNLPSNRFRPPPHFDLFH